MARVVISPRADRELEELWLTILLTMSERRTGSFGPLVIRMLVEYPYLILCETHPNTDRGPIDEVGISRSSMDG